MNRRNLSLQLAGLAAIVFAAMPLLSTPVSAHDEKMEASKAANLTVTVKGEIIDTACYANHPDSAHGAGHKDCAASCLAKGVPMSLLTDKGDVYLLVPDHSNEKVYNDAKGWAAEQVEISGRLVTTGGMKAIIVATSKKA
jgi:hypothetical protein